MTDAMLVKHFEGVVVQAVDRMVDQFFTLTVLFYC